MNEKKTTWVFTFGAGHAHAGYFVLVRDAEWSEARDRMTRAFGTDWAFQLVLNDAKNLKRIANFKMLGALIRTQDTTVKLIQEKQIHENDIRIK